MAAIPKVKKLDQSTLEILCQRLVEAVNAAQVKEMELEDILKENEQNRKEFRGGKVAKDTFKVDDAKFRNDEAAARQSINDAVNDGLDQIHALKMLVKSEEVSLPGMPANKPVKKHHAKHKVTHKKAHHKAHAKTHHKKG
ncbi:MAG: hypothetical protein V1887_00890 [Candidatus Aenigmatarchaeota archaeon]